MIYMYMLKRQEILTTPFTSLYRKYFNSREGSSNSNEVPAQTVCDIGSSDCLNESVIESNCVAFINLHCMRSQLAE